MKRTGRVINAKRDRAGRLYVWTYPEGGRSYAGWHLTADRIGCARVCEATRRLFAGSVSEPQVLPALPVTRAVLEVPNNGRAKARSARELRLFVAKDPRHFSLSERDEALTITAGHERLNELCKNVVAITDTQGDFAMRPDGKWQSDQALWFWWLLSETTTP